MGPTKTRGVANPKAPSIDAGQRACLRFSERCWICLASYERYLWPFLSQAKKERSMLMNPFVGTIAVVFATVMMCSIVQAQEDKSELGSGVSQHLS